MPELDADREVVYFGSSVLGSRERMPGIAGKLFSEVILGCQYYQKEIAADEGLG